MGKILVGHKWIEEKEYLKELNPAGSSGFMQNTKSSAQPSKSASATKAPPGSKPPPTPEPKKADPIKPRIPQTEWAAGDSAAEPVELGKETPIIFNPAMKDTQNNISSGDLTLSRQGKDKGRNTSTVTEEARTPHYLRWYNGVKGLAPHQHLQAATHHETKAAFYEKFPSRKEPYKRLPEMHRKMATWHRKLMPDDFVSPTSDTKFKNTSNEERIAEGDVVAAALGGATKMAAHGLKRMFGAKKRGGSPMPGGPRAQHMHLHYGDSHFHYGGKGGAASGVASGATIKAPQQATPAKPAQAAKPAQPTKPASSSGPWGPHKPASPSSATGPKIKQDSPVHNWSDIKSTVSKVSTPTEKPRIRVKATSVQSGGSVSKPVDKPSPSPQDGPTKMSGKNFRELLKKNPDLKVRAR
jgi:hypothetical protein